jgi:hypothetical protein
LVVRFLRFSTTVCSVSHGNTLILFLQSRLKQFFSPKGAGTRVRNLAKVFDPRIHFAGLKVSVGRAPEAEIYDRADAALLQKPAPSLGSGVSL